MSAQKNPKKQVRCILDQVDILKPGSLAFYARGTQSLSSNCSSFKDLKCTHSNYRALDESGIIIFHHYLGLRPVGNLRACCLP